MQGPSTLIHPASPAADWLKELVVPSLIEAAPYKIDTPAVSIKLDQNESPWDLPPKIKARVLERLSGRAWNRYPPAFADELAAKVARYVGVPPEAVLLGPGSNYLVSLALTVFAKGAMRPGARAKVVVARPSFPLYESHCRYEGIPYTAWELDENLEYDVRRLPELPRGSFVVFASPNNPVGNVLKRRDFEALLARHPEVLFLADEAYVEYAAEPYTELVGKYPNVLLLRTFSKTMGCAGVRLGYFVGAPAYLGLMRKLRLPYLLNYFSLVCADVLLDDPEMREHLRHIQQNAVRERQRVYDELASLGGRGGFTVKGSEANFLLLRWPTTELALAAYRQLIGAGILVRDITGNPGLKGCLRITVGDERENAALIAAFKRMAG